MTDSIEHVILLALENRSFDQMLGSLGALGLAIDGASPTNVNAGRTGTYSQQPTIVRQMRLDPMHELAHVARQLAGGNGGFIADFEDHYGSSVTDDDRRAVMGYYPPRFLPALHRLALDFTVCDRWFSSVPGPTWPNRFFLLSGTSNGRISMPGDDNRDFTWRDWNAQDQDTIFDRLNERGIHWKSYFHDIPQSSMLTHQWQPHNAARYFSIDEFYRDAAGRADDFPQFSFVEPNFMGFDENDDHPPHDIMKAERLVAHVYNAVRANPALWQSTLLVVLFDEHGGFYDHVPPPAAVPPDGNTLQYTFDRLGLRVPALLISPWVDRRVEKTEFDHTSLLKYLIDKWGLGPLGQRTAQANSIAVALTRSALRPDSDSVARIELTEQELSPPDPELEEEATTYQSRHHLALQRVGKFLKATSVTLLPRVLAPIARVFEFVKGQVAAPFERLLRGPHRLRSSMTQPDKLHRATVVTREDFAVFLRRKKEQAPSALAARLDRPGLSEAEREHDIHTLALITKRRFHREEGRHQAVQNWLRKHKYR
jgi:phospholipase C